MKTSIIILCILSFFSCDLKQRDKYEINLSSGTGVLIIFNNQRAIPEYYFNQSAPFKLERECFNGTSISAIASTPFHFVIYLNDSLVFDDINTYIIWNN